MLCRELTDVEQAGLLSQQEVDALPAGTAVTVKWSGGNGPHRYKIRRVRGEVCVDNIYEDPLHFVGIEQFHTRVFLS